MTTKKKAIEKSPKSKLSLIDQEFCDYYRCADPDLRGNAKKCYLKLHPKASDRTAETEGSRTLRKPEVSAYLIRKSLELERSTDVTNERVMREWGKIAFANIIDLFDPITGNLILPHLLPRDVAAIISEIQSKTILGEGGQPGAMVEVKYKLNSKQAALDSIARHFNMFIERKELSVKMDIANMTNEEMDNYEEQLKEEISILEEEERLAKKAKYVH